MPSETSPTDIAITGLSVSPSVVAPGGLFTVNVTVFAPNEDWEDGVAFRLFVSACSCGGEPPKQDTPSPVRGHVQDPIWPTRQSVIPFKFTAGSTPGFYEIKAALVEGPSGTPDPDDPISFSCLDCGSGVFVVS